MPNRIVNRVVIHARPEAVERYLLSVCGITRFNMYALYPGEVFWAAPSGFLSTRTWWEDTTGSRTMPAIKIEKRARSIVLVYCTAWRPNAPLVERLHDCS